MIKKIFLFLLILNLSVNAASMPKYGGSLSIGIKSIPSTLDPAKAVTLNEKEICSKLYSSLPLLSKSWDNFKDGLTWIFYLLPEVQFHNYQPVTAYDVKQSFERVVNPATNSPYSYIFDAIQGIEEYKSGQTTEINGIKVLDTNTVEIDLRYLDNSFLQNLYLCAASILPIKEVNDTEKNFWTHPLGSGPFRFVSLNENEIILETNEYYFEGRPYMDEIKFKVIPEDKAKDSMVKGDVDIVYPSAFEYPSFTEDINWQQNTIFNSKVTTLFLGINCKNQLLKNISIREAINLSVNREKLKELLPSTFEISSIVLPSSLLELFRKEIIYNPDESKNILNREEYQQLKNESLLLYVPNEPKELTKIGEEIRDELLSIGLNIQLAVKPTSEFVSAVNSDAPALFLCSWTAENKETKNFYLYMGNQLLPFTYYSNDKISDLINQIKQSINVNEATKYYQEIENLFMQEKVFISLGYLPYTIIYQPKLLDIQIEFNKLDLNSTWKMP